MVQVRKSSAVFGIAVTAIGLSSVINVAHADRRKPAKIVFADTGEATQSQNQSSNVAVSGAKSKRIEFRYPDQPSTFYADGGQKTVNPDAAPMAFSSSTSAINANQAKQYSAVKDIPNHVPAGTISTGGFDARAEAQRVASKRAAQTGPRKLASFSPSPLKNNTNAAEFNEQGLAGIYAAAFQGQPTANGEIFDHDAMTAAHPTLPLPSLVQVSNKKNGKEVVLRVNDRGPFDGKRSIDVTKRAANVLEFNKKKPNAVTVRYLGPAPALVEGKARVYSAVLEESMPTVVAQPSLPAPTLVSLSQSSMTNAFYIQVGSFADIGNAERLNHSLGRGMPVEIQQARVHGGDYFRVMVGPFDNRGQAETYQSHLASSGVAQGFVVSK